MGETGVIWCPGCDTVLRWTQEVRGKELTDEAVEHLTSHHGFEGSRILSEPQPLF